MSTRLCDNLARGTGRDLVAEQRCATQVSQRRRAVVGAQSLDIYIARSESQVGRRTSVSIELTSLMQFRSLRRHRSESRARLVRHRTGAQRVARRRASARISLLCRRSSTHRSASAPIVGTMLVFDSFCSLFVLVALLCSLPRRTHARICCYASSQRCPSATRACTLLFSSTTRRRATPPSSVGLHSTSLPRRLRCALVRSIVSFRFFLSNLRFDSLDVGFGSAVVIDICIDRRNRIKLVDVAPFGVMVSP